MKSVMISIKPKWCELIASGKKTVEVRKTRPKIEMPFKCYIYQTVDGRTNTVDILENNLGKVIGEFVCDNIYPIRYERDGFYVADLIDCKTSCLKPRDFIVYGKGKPLYGWSISGLIIYDKPKELSEFYKEDFHEVLSMYEDLFSIGVPTGCVVKYPPEPKKEDYILTRPPQSWGYCEEAEE